VNEIHYHLNLNNINNRWCLHMTVVLIGMTVGVYAVVMKRVLNHVTKPHPVHK